MENHEALKEVLDFLMTKDFPTTQTFQVLLSVLTLMMKAAEGISPTDESFPVIFTIYLSDGKVLTVGKFKTETSPLN